MFAINLQLVRINKDRGHCFDVGIHQSMSSLKKSPLTWWRQLDFLETVAVVSYDRTKIESRFKHG